ncbi:hypothetical protein [Companilactobacillus sp.]|nr:hypothetical protein [Companilactobacillus sp.]
MVYALYHGEEFLNVGTLQELAKYILEKIEEDEHASVKRLD